MLTNPPICTIVHPKHGKAIASEDQLEQFLPLGWKREDQAAAEDPAPTDAPDPDPSPTDAPPAAPAPAGKKSKK